MGRQSKDGEKTPYLKSAIKKQLHGREFCIVQLDVESDTVIRAIENDVARNPNSFRYVEYLGIRMLVKLQE